VVIASSGLGAIALAQREQPVVIVLESDLPEISGWQILAQLRAEPGTREIPVVICLWPDSDRHCDANEFEWPLHKPMEFHDFVSALNGLGVLSADNPARTRYSLPADA
jgi:CheY-like chemotaxis protein